MEEARGNEEREKRERIEKGSHCFFKSQDKLELKHKKLVFFKLIVCISKKIMSWCENMCY